MAGKTIALWAVLGGAAALGLAACDNGPSAVAQKQGSSAQVASRDAAAGPDDGYSSPSQADGGQVDHRREPVKLVDGKPMWSASRKFSAAENAQRAFDRNGRDFGAKNIDAFIGKAHAFVEHPPKGTLTLTRKNGDTLFYDPKSNVFAVASKEGAPRTMFHPDDGMSYWEEQKAREARSQNGRRNRRDDDA